MPFALFVLDANAQSWPSRPIDVIIPFPAGGSVDVIGRAIATAIGEARPTGRHRQSRRRQRTIGFNALASATPDGYTLGAGPTTPIANAPYLMKGVRYGVDSFEYICHVFENAFTITVAPQSKFKSARELLAAAAETRQAQLRPLGQRHHPHLAVGNLADALKLKFQPVPFRGEARSCRLCSGATSISALWRW
jgi:tripartite-type tricarboxylate transporter receptor subunit TctC